MSCRVTFMSIMFAGYKGAGAFPFKCAPLVSAQAEQPRRDIYRFFGVETTGSAGLLSIVAVALAGLTLGFFGWYYAVLPLHRDLVSEVALPAGMIAGAIISLVLWQSYSAYFARRA